MDRFNRVRRCQREQEGATPGVEVRGLVRPVVSKRRKKGLVGGSKGPLGGSDDVYALFNGILGRDHGETDDNV